MPGKPSQRFPVQWRIEAIVDPWVLLSHQHHDNQGYICWPQSFKSFWSVSGSPVVKGGAGNVEPAWSVNGQLPIDKVLVPFTLQDKVVEGDVEFLYVDKYRSFGNSDHFFIT